MTEYAPKGLIGLVVPQANTTAEPEFQALCPPGMVPLTARMTSGKSDMDARLVDYIDGFGETVAQFANAPLGVVALACTGMSYIVPADQERRALGAIEADKGCPVLTSSGAIAAALEALDTTRVGILSPYGDRLHEQAMAYWAGRGLDIVRTTRVSEAKEAFHPIYGLNGDAACRGLGVLGTEGIDAAVILGTGLPTMHALLTAGVAPVPVLSPNLALAWLTVATLSGRSPDAASLMPWLTGEEWQERATARLILPKST